MSTRIKEVTGNVLTLNRGLIVHGCNAQGKMKSGFAKDLRAKYPGAYEVYYQEFLRNGLQLGGVTFYEHPVSLLDDSQIVIANAITQKYYGRNKDVVYVSYPAVATCFRTVGTKARELGLPLHFPLVGCGLANGSWEEVAQRIEQAVPPEVECTLWLLPPGSS